AHRACGRSQDRQSRGRARRRGSPGTRRTPHGRSRPRRPPRSNLRVAGDPGDPSRARYRAPDGCGLGRARGPRLPSRNLRCTGPVAVRGVRGLNTDAEGLAMSGLFESLSTASSSLLAQRMGLDVVGQNIANINTPGYSRRSLVVAEVPPTDSLSAGGGVSVVEVRAWRDALVEARLRRAQGGTAYDGALAEVLGSVEAAIGMPGESIDAELTRFFGAFAELAVDPTSAAARDEVVRQGSALSGAFRS